MKVVINKCFGGFSLSYKAVMRYAELKDMKIYAELDDISKKVYGAEASIENEKGFVHYNTKHPSEREDINDGYWSDRDVPRDDPMLIQIVEEMGGEKSGGRCADLEIVEIPDDVKWKVEEYDGNEWIAEEHRTWP